MSWVVPGNGVTEIFHSQCNKTYISSLGNIIRLRFNLKKKTKSKKVFFSLVGCDFNAKIYLPAKLYKDYGYGKINGTNDLIVLKITKDILEITSFKNGWPYSNIIFHQVYK